MILENCNCSADEGSSGISGTVRFAAGASNASNGGALEISSGDSTCGTHVQYTLYSTVRLIVHVYTYLRLQYKIRVESVELLHNKCLVNLIN